MQNRRDVQVGSRDNQQKPRTDQGRFLASHASWSGWVDFILVLRGRCSGSRYTCCFINTLGLTELVSDALGSRKQKEEETNAKIVDLLKHALDETKNCRNEEQGSSFTLVQCETRLVQCENENFACAGDTGYE